MHYYVLIYGTPQEITEEVNKIQFYMDDLGSVGQIRELRLFELVFKKEQEENIKKKLNNPNPKIENIADFIRHFCFGLKIDGHLVVFQRDNRSHEKFKSPSVNIVGFKEDSKHLDGREVL